MDEELYKMLQHLDEPKRIIGLTLDDCLIGGLTVFLATIASNKIIILIAGFCIRLGVRKLLKGNPPSYLLLLMYWHIPHALVRLFIRHLPPSYQRYWIS